MKNQGLLERFRDAQTGLNFVFSVDNQGFDLSNNYKNCPICGKKVYSTLVISSKGFYKPYECEKCQSHLYKKTDFTDKIIYGFIFVCFFLSSSWCFLLLGVALLAYVLYRHHYKEIKCEWVHPTYHSKT